MSEKTKCMHVFSDLLVGPPDLDVGCERMNPVGHISVLERERGSVFPSQERWDVKNRMRGGYDTIAIFCTNSLKHLVQCHFLKLVLLAELFLCIFLNV